MSNFYPETIALETLRQKIETALQESGSLADYLDRGRPNPSEASEARRQIAELVDRAALWRLDLAHLVANTRAQCLPAFEQWIALHIEALGLIAAETPADGINRTRRMLAAGALHQWERVRTGEETYVGTNSHFLADHQQAMQRLVAVLPC
jgi:hypothetical protein